MKQLKSTRAVAQELGVSQRSVERYRKGERKHPPKHIADKIDAAVRSRWQPLVRQPTQAGRRHRRDHGGDKGPLRLHRAGRHDR